MLRTLDTLIYDLRAKKYRLEAEIESLSKSSFPTGFLYEPKTVELFEMFEQARGDGSITKEGLVDWLLFHLEKVKEAIELVEKYKSDKSFLAPHILEATPQPVKRVSIEVIGSPVQYIGHILKDPSYAINAMVMEYVPEKNLILFKNTRRGVISEEDNGFAYSVDSFANLVISHLLRIISPHMRRQQINIKEITVLEVDENDVEYTVQVNSENQKYVLGITKEKVIFQNVLHQ